MKIEVHRDKCVEGCSLCFEACPQVTQEMTETYSKSELMEFFHSSSLDESITRNCPESAFEENQSHNHQLNKEKCSDCGLCMEKSDGKILHDGETPIKCNLCAGEEDYKCVKACPYNALEVVYTQEEKNTLREKIGYRVRDLEKTREIEGKIAITKERDEPVYFTGEENLGLQEAKITSEIIKHIRENETGTDRSEIEAETERKCLEMNLEITEDHVEKIARYIHREINGLSILETLIEDEELEEISIIAPKKPLYVYHVDHGWIQTDLEITNPEKVKNLINKAARKLDRRITLKKPRVNANIDKGRIHGAIEPLATTGNCMTIRKFIKDKFKPKDLVENNTIDPGLMKLIERTMKCDTNILIAGNTGSGKTTTLNTLLNFLPETERLILVEETPEVNPPQDHVIRLTTSPSLDIEMYQLVTDTLRMRPDRIIVGEVRDEKEVEALFNTMLAGQGKGTITTFHGNSTEETLTRLKSLGISRNDLKTIDLILVQRRWIDHSEESEEKRKVIQASTLDKDSEPIEIYSKEKGYRPEKMKGTKLMEKLELSYGENQEQIIKEVKDESR